MQTKKEKFKTIKISTELYGVLEEIFQHFDKPPTEEEKRLAVEFLIIQGINRAWQISERMVLSQMRALKKLEKNKLIQS